MVSQTAQYPANLMALHQSFQEMAAATKSPMTKERPLATEVEADESDGRVRRSRRLPRRCSIPISSADLRQKIA
jgi:hypothetical protein